MKRFPRRLSKALAAMSLVAFILISLPWGRSYFRGDWLIFGDLQLNWCISSCHGMICFKLNDYRVDSQLRGVNHTGLRWETWLFGDSSDGWRSSEIPDWPNRHMFYFKRAGETLCVPADHKWRTEDEYTIRAGVNGIRTELSTNFAFPTAVTLILPAWYIWARFGTRNRNNNEHCSVCGYDLRATPDRCPECGTVPVKKAIISN